ncbi:MAG: type 1 glutamine amidotransferase [Proteobacteria bacterium]|nr:type 1 glutamine amidotransferase [Pseudomonadota bacterium]MBU1639243.1 type 1 glutamine amidotransferase [Pseudomonadota bacterium]
MTKKLAVFQHSPWEGPGLFLLQAAKLNKIELIIIKAWEKIFPDPIDYDGFIILGGSANVHEEDLYPFLVAEKKSLQEILAANTPCLGICLGHQLLADALGAQIGPNFCYSIGISQAFLTITGRNHSIFKGFASPFPTFKWHAQAVIPPVPRHFQILATSQECQVEAFSIKERPHIIGIQFDNNAAHPDDATAWYEQDHAWLSSLSPAPIDKGHLLAELASKKDQIELQFNLLFSSFCTML